MSKELRQKRHELESENLLLLKEFARENSLKLGKLRKVYTEIGGLDLGKRLAQVIFLKQSQGSQLMFSLSILFRQERAFNLCKLLSSQLLCPILSVPLNIVLME